MVFEFWISVVFGLNELASFGISVDKEFELFRLWGGHRGGDVGEWVEVLWGFRYFRVARA